MQSMVIKKLCFHEKTSHLCPGLPNLTIFCWVDISPLCISSSWQWRMLCCKLERSHSQPDLRSCRGWVNSDNILKRSEVQVSEWPYIISCTSNGSIFDCFRVSQRSLVQVSWKVASSCPNQATKLLKKKKKKWVLVRLMTLIGLQG
jgi:hypothetical protein